MNAQFAAGKNKPGATFSSRPTPTPIEPQSSSYWDSVVNFFRRIYESKPNLKKCKQYSKYNEEAKRMFIRSVEAQSGLTIIQYGILSQSAVHQCAVSHNLLLGVDAGIPGSRTNQYQFMVNYQTTNGGIVARADSNKVVHGILEQKFLNRKLHVKTDYDSYNKNMKLDATYFGKDWAFSTKISKAGEIDLGFLQRITPKLCMGISTSYNNSVRETDIAGAIRYQPDKSTVIALELKENGKGNKFFKGSYVKAVDYSLDMVAELQYNFKDRKATYRYGFEQEFLNSNYKCNINQDNQFMAVFEHKISNVSMSFNVQVDPTKKNKKQDFLGMMMGPNAVELPDVTFGVQVIIEPTMIAE